MTYNQWIEELNRKMDEAALAGDYEELERLMSEPFPADLIEEAE
jgi:hypothetical protein